MTVHMIALRAEDPPEYSDSQIRQAIEDWVSSYDEVLSTQRLDLSLVTDTDAPEHYAGRWRFAWSEDEGNILEDLTADLRPYVAWYRIGYHECDHDEAEPSGCSWSAEREYGTPPEGVPAYL